MDGKAIAKEIRKEVEAGVARVKEAGITPRMAVLLVGYDPASRVYAQSKQKMAERMGIAYDFIELPATTEEDRVLAEIDRLNRDAAVHGIMVELPLPKHINKDRVMASVAPDKDIDGITPTNRGYLIAGEEGLFPATPQSCIEIMLRSGVELAGKNAVIVGRGDTVGKPLVFLLLKHNPTITICHSKTRDLKAHTLGADILIVATGKPGLVTGDMVKPGAVVVDAGINQVGDSIVGDVVYEEAEKVAGKISPVPGGVGSLTTVLIMRNVLKAIYLQRARLGVPTLEV
jgi:methylenetetrahydrofolate dehydrogenase (NADP+)/methenyltetrahydrofolate cyclohydrolase